MTFWQENYGFIKEVYDTRYDLTSLFAVTIIKTQSTIFFKKIIQVCQDDRMDGQRGNGHCKGSLDLFLLQCYDSGQLLMKN